jgi:hypothetical protein
MSRLPGGAHSAAARGPPLAVKTNLGSSERPYLVDENGHIVAGLGELRPLNVCSKCTLTSLIVLRS